MAKKNIEEKKVTLIQEETKEEKNEMATTQVVPGVQSEGNGSDAAKIINRTTVKQPQTVTDLDSGADSKITVEYQRYVLNPKSTSTVDEQLEEALALVQPKDNQVDALLKYATNASYTAGKNAALAGGNYLTPELRRKIVTLLSDHPNFAELSAKDIGDRWLAGYKAKSPKAIEWLNRAKQLLSAEELDF